MENVTIDKINQYKSVLSLDDIVDMEELFNNYLEALHDYLENSTYDIGKLKLLIDAFYYFSGFDVLAYDFAYLKKVGIALLEMGKKDRSKYSYSQLVYIVSYLIGQKLIQMGNLLSGVEVTNNCIIMNELLSVVKSIDEYEHKVKVKVN